MACRFATWPTNRSPVLVKPTTDGVVRPPSSLGITFGSPPSMTATTELVVPRSIPIIFAIAVASCGQAGKNVEVGTPAGATEPDQSHLECLLRLNTIAMIEPE